MPLYSPFAAYGQYYSLHFATIQATRKLYRYTTNPNPKHTLHLV